MNVGPVSGWIIVAGALVYLVVGLLWVFAAVRVYDLEDVSHEGSRYLGLPSFFVEDGFQWLAAFILIMTSIFWWVVVPITALAFGARYIGDRIGDRASASYKQRSRYLAKLEEENREMREALRRAEIEINQEIPSPL